MILRWGTRGIIQHEAFNFEIGLFSVENKPEKKHLTYIISAKLYIALDTITNYIKTFEKLNSSIKLNVNQFLYYVFTKCPDSLTIPVTLKIGLR